MAINPEPRWTLPWRPSPSRSTACLPPRSNSNTSQLSPQASPPHRKPNRTYTHCTPLIVPIFCRIFLLIVETFFCSFFSSPRARLQFIARCFELFSSCFLYCLRDSSMASPNLAKQGEKEPATLERTPEIRETESGNVEVRKDPEHTSKLSKPTEKILDPRGGSDVATNPHDVLAVRRTVDETDTPLE